MSCDRRCYDPDNDLFLFDECSKCPGMDSQLSISIPVNKGMSHPNNKYWKKDMFRQNKLSRLSKQNKEL